MYLGILNSNIRQKFILLHQKLKSRLICGPAGIRQIGGEPRIKPPGQMWTWRESNSRLRNLPAVHCGPAGN